MNRYLEKIAAMGVKPIFPSHLEFKGYTKPLSARDAIRSGKEARPKAMYLKQILGQNDINMKYIPRFRANMIPSKLRG